MGMDIKNATSKASVKTHYKSMAKKNHPDLGGSAEKMKDLNGHMEHLEQTSFYKNLPDFDKKPFNNGFKKAAVDSSYAWWN
jgi:DnaJ-class molecular chaperone